MKTRVRLWLAKAIGCALAITSVCARADDEAAQTSADAGAAPPTSVLVRIKGDPELVLERFDAHDGWRAVCRAPCGNEVPLDADYRLRNGGRKSGAFRFSAGSKDVELRPSSAGTGLATAGTVAMTIGGGTVVGSGMASVAGFLYGGCNACGPLAGVGLGLVGVGVVLFVVGASKKLGFEAREVSNVTSSRSGGIGLGTGGLAWSF